MNKQTKRLNTENLLVEELQPGRIYRCHLSGDREVQYIGEGKIKWYNSQLDEYRETTVTDYQLKPLFTTK